MPEPTPFAREVRRTARLAGPLIGGQLTLVGMNFTDTVMAGRLDAGTLAAVAVGSSVWASIMLSIAGTLMPMAPAIAHSDSAGRRDLVATLARQTLWVALGLAAVGIVIAANLRPLLELLRVEAEIVPTAAGYLRALCWGVPAWAAYMVLRNLCEGLGSTRPTLYFGLLGLGANVFADWVLMYGRFGFPRLGAVGCGHATAFVWCLQFVGMAVYVARRARYRDLELTRRFERPHPEWIRRILRLGLPAGVMTMMEVSMFTAVALAIGTMGTTIVAGHQVALNFAALTFMVPLGLSMATGVRVGRAAGRNDLEGVQLAAKVGLGLSLTAQTVSASAMVLFPRAIAGLYTEDAAVVAIAVELLALAAIFQISDGVQVSSAGSLRGLGDTRVPMWMTGVAYWLVGLPLGLALGFPAGLGGRGLWIGMIGGLTAAALMLAVRWRSVSRRPLSPPVPAPAARG